MDGCGQWDVKLLDSCANGLALLSLAGGILANTSPGLFGLPCNSNAYLNMFQLHFQAVTGGSDLEQLTSCKGSGQAHIAYCKMSQRPRQRNRGKLLSYRHRDKDVRNGILLKISMCTLKYLGWLIRMLNFPIRSRNTHLSITALVNTSD